MSGRAWVAGGTGGIGAACVAGLRADGFTVHASDRPSEDICLPGVADSVAGRLAAEGGLTAAVHAVGMSGRSLGDGPLSTCTDQAWDEVLRVDLTSVFRFLRSCLRHADRGASVVVIGSTLAGRIHRDFQTAAYRIAKAALVPLVEAAAYEGADRGIRVNLVAPALVQTPMSARALSDERIRARFAELMPLTSRPSQPSEVAAAVRWLVGADSPHTTGAVLPVDGGWRLC
jgi:NAD(P)-dependent dehydrogenase (short-subunit alcohol dehydrogenase family)